MRSKDAGIVGKGMECSGKVVLGVSSVKTKVRTKSG